MTNKNLNYLSSLNKNKQPIIDLSVSQKKENSQLIIQKNNPNINYIQADCIHHLFELQSQQNSDSIAVIFEDEQLTYKQLNCLANKVARYLQTLGVNSEVLVGICIERSLYTIIGLLGILKAGAAYIPIDPGYPQERLSLMLADAQVSVVLTQNKLLEIVTSCLIVPDNIVICLDGDWNKIDQQSDENLNTNVTPDNLAYIIYTSGSTGKPKGVQIEHRSVVNFLISMSREPGINAQDVLLAVTTISFDIAGLEIYLPLIIGGSLVLASREVTTDGKALIELLNRSGATIMQATPATWQMLMVAGWKGNKQLKILCGGEALSPKLASQLLERCGSLWNMYGPTETTIWSMVYKVETVETFIPIGHPIANTQIYILDQKLRCPTDPIKPAPIGVAGEVYIGGDGVARGYLNRPDLTNERFIPDSFSDKPNARLYKTGDLARYLADGNIEYIGRIDNQVKIRGYRIELGEIEAVLRQNPSVREAVVIPWESSNGDKRLVAYVVPFTESQDASGEQTAQWQEIWDDAYSQPNAETDPTFNINGWNNSYTGLPVPAADIKEWVDNTVRRILGLQPQRVLEIGCGTGLLLFRIIPHCQHYCGTDITAASVDYVEQQLQKQQHASQVKLYQRAADNLEGIGNEPFDTVIINSVIQYFPNIEYLVNVLENLLSKVQLGGCIFVGDVRSLPLLKAFHTSVQLFQAPASLSTDKLKQRIQERMNQEKGLVIDPAFFTALQQYLPQISDVQIQLKRGRYHNELVRFRYDVVLRVGGAVPDQVEYQVIDWQQQQLTLPSVCQMLESEKPERLLIRRVPNARVLADVKAIELLANDNTPRTVVELRDTLQDITQDAVEPEDFWALSDEFPYTIEINWSGVGDDGYYDVVFKRVEGNINSTDNFPLLSVNELGEKLDWSSYANNPIQENASEQLVPQLRNFLKAKIAEYMLPATFVIMDTLPLTPNGKVDRRSLPTPTQQRPILDLEFVAPRNSIEQKLVEIWVGVLQIEPIGIHDNFFELGGHSLLSAQLLTGIEEVFQIKLPVMSLFEKPTVAGLAEIINNGYQSSILSNFNSVTLQKIQADTILDPAIFPADCNQDLVTEPANILLTGATGFLGAFLLHELLQKTQANIYCLVRAANLQSAEQKIKTNLTRYALWHENLISRIIPVVGDLSQPLLGLSEPHFQSLASEIDVIYHNGAFVNLIYPYCQLRATNVLGTQEVLRFASSKKLKPVHYTSSLAVFESDNYADMKGISEQDKLADCMGMTDGYSQSKWVAEKLLIAGRERGIPVCIYRPGMITGHSKTGITNTDDLMCRLLTGFIQMGSAPDLDLVMDMTPVDYVSSTIVYLSRRQQESFGKTFHLVNLQPLALAELIREINSLGYCIQQIPYQEWKSQLIEQTKNSPDNNALNPVLPLVTENLPGKQRTYLENSSMTSQSFDCQNTLRGLLESPISCPPVDAQLLNTYFNYLKESSFLNKPST